MNLRKITLSIGIKRPLRLLHLSDTHLAYADERDGQRKQELAAKRFQLFRDALPYLDEALAYGKEHCELLIHTGDLIDFVSVRNLELMKEKLSVMDSFFAAGNHEYSQYVGEAWEDEAYKMQSFDRVQTQVANDLVFASREIAGVNLVALENGYYYFTAGELEKLKQEAAKGLPIVLLMHNPLHCDDLYDKMLHERKEAWASIVGTPENLLAVYPEMRQRQQRPNAETLAFIEYIKQEPLIKAILTGHLHFDYETTLYGRLPMIVTGGGFRGCATELEIR